ncbi:hypothetical protein EDC96DRAFT_567360 [Choanephora cucurbitarum]|nr:hypothetical protein EDC96DRAFT_567360 [Choanephora cucurbitarum]
MWYHANRCTSHIDNKRAQMESNHVHLFEPQAEDILTDEDLLDLFRIIKRVLRKDPDAERISKLLFSIYYALTDHVQFSKPCDEDRILFRDRDSVVHSVQLPTSGCNQVHHSTPLSTPSPTLSHKDLMRPTDSFSVHLCSTSLVRYTPIPVDKTQSSQEILTEPQQRGFYYQEGRIAREPILLQRYAEQGILTQATLIRKRKKQADDSLSVKKPKIPHRHGDFESRRDDILARLRSITLLDLEQKARQLPSHFTLAIETPTENGIHYNPDYFRLYLAFEQFQQAFAILFPTETVQAFTDKDRNLNMKAYRPWIEPLLSDTNWAAFRRNIMVGERMRQLTQSIGQGILLMTRELSGSKLHLTFTNSEWDEFLDGLNAGQWDVCRPYASLVSELQAKFNTSYWFHSDGSVVSIEQRRLLLG